MRRSSGCFWFACILALAGCEGDDDPLSAGPSVGGGGFTASHPNQFPCGSPENVGGESSGFAECQSGLLVRSSVGTCSSQLPRPDDIEDYQSGVDECQSDAGCMRFSNGFCRREEEGAKATCGYGCVSDDDCQSPLICLCGEPVGLCVEAACRTDGDCIEGYHCAYNQACATFACQHEDDSCATDADCDEGECVLSKQRRSCSTDASCD